MDNRNGEVDIFVCANMNSLLESDYFSPAKSTEKFNCDNWGFLQKEADLKSK